MIRAAFFDIDGTVLSHKTNSVPASTVRALEALREKGVLTFIATGRHETELRKLRPLDGLCFDGVISLNGQYCRRGDEVLHHCPIDPADVAAMLAYLEEHPLPCILVEADRMYMNFHNALVERVQADIHSALPDLGDLERGRTVPIYQIILYLTAEELAALPELPNLKRNRWHPDGVDIIRAGGGKNAGIAKILEHYGIDKSETIAFGDGENDVDMFRAVGISVAMGNACDAAKNAADYITDEVDENGIWNALKHFGVL